MKSKVKSQKSKVKSAWVWLTWLFVLAGGWIGSVDFAWAQAPARLAIVDWQDDERGEMATVLRILAKDPSFELLDDDLVRAAVRGSGYAGSLNLSRDDARSLGLSLGCEFYVLGKVLVTRRAGVGEQFYFDAISGVFFVETRTGNLLLFDWQREQAQNEAEARVQLKTALQQNWPRYAAALRQAREHHITEIAKVSQPAPPAIEMLTDETVAQGLQQPTFFQRLKPTYPEQADLVGIAATVELEAVFGEDGRVGEILVTRWAGFGLDESAIATVKQLRFKPAEREGKNLTVRGLVRYTFRRPLPQTVPSQLATPEERERIKQSLRRVLIPEKVPVSRPKP